VSVVRSNANQALEELSEVLHLLRHPDTTADTEREEIRAAPPPTVDRLPALVEEARRSGQQVRADLGDGLTAIRPQLQRTVYRMVQQLHLSTSSIKATISSALTRLDLTNRIQLAILAHESRRG